MSQLDRTNLWTDDPKILLNPDLLIHNNSRNATWNSITRAVVLILVIGGIGSYAFDISFIVVLFIAASLYYGEFIYKDLIKPVLQQPAKEGFASVQPSDLEPGFEDKGVDKNPYVTNPTARNPFMNVLMDEIKYNPTRPAAAPINDLMVKATLDDFFKVQWTNDPTDVFGKTQGQRSFYTMPNTSIPNDRASYQNWLYLVPGKTCKEGGRDQCNPGTNGGYIPWLSKPN